MVLMVCVHVLSHVLKVCICTIREAHVFRVGIGTREAHVLKLVWNRSSPTERIEALSEVGISRWVGLVGLHEWADLSIGTEAHVKVRESVGLST